MTRREARETAFILLFEKTFTEDSLQQILENAGEARDLQKSAFALSLAQGAVDHLEEEDALISAHSLKWNKDRLSRVALSILRLAVYEMEFVEDMPVSVSINEAVELAKKYGGDEDPSFINGVLGGIARRPGAGKAERPADAPAVPENAEMEEFPDAEDKIHAAADKIPEPDAKA